MHLFSVCHKDIKYDNIGISKKYNKFIFLDFGFAKSIK